MQDLRRFRPLTKGTDYKGKETTAENLAMILLTHLLNFGNISVSIKWVLSGVVALLIKRCILHPVTCYPVQNLPSHKATQWNVIQRIHYNRTQNDTKCSLYVQNITICVKSQWPILRTVSNLTQRWNQARKNVMKKHTRPCLNSPTTKYVSFWAHQV